MQKQQSTQQSHFMEHSLDPVRYNCNMTSGDEDSAPWGYTTPQCAGSISVVFNDIRVNDSVVIKIKDLLKI